MPSSGRFFRVCIALAALAALAAAAPAAAETVVPERALFVSTIQVPPAIATREGVLRLVEDAKAQGVTALFVQLYRGNKSWFPSEVADDSDYEAALEAAGEDPVALLIHEAHAADIAVHAWLNLMSLGGNAEAPLLARHGPGILTRNVEEKKTLDDYKIDNQFFLEPGDPRVSDAMSRVVEEVLNTYPALDGVQFDYIRYPDWHPWHGHTEANEARFRESAGRAEGPISEYDPAWREWKRAQVTALVDRLAAVARATKPGIAVSTTGLVPYTRAYHEASQDWKLWIESGRVDFVTLMCYSKSTRQLERYVRDARRRLGSLDRVVLAVGAYKLVGSPRTFRAQFRVSEEAAGGGTAVFHYGSLVEDPALAGPLRKRAR